MKSAVVRTDEGSGDLETEGDNLLAGESDPAC